MIKIKSLSLLFFLGMISSLIAQDSAKAQFGEIEIPCGKKSNLSSLQIFAQCPVDADKDDIPDQSYSKMVFTNLSDQDSYITIGENLSRGINKFITFLIKAKKSASLPISNEAFNSETQRYRYPAIKLGKLNIPATDTFSDELSCDDIQEGGRKKFGVTYQLVCNKEINLLKLEPSGQKNARIIVVKYRNKQGADITESITGIDYPFDWILAESNKYQIQILIPDPNGSLGIVV